MKKVLFLLLAFSSLAFGQSYPSPTYNNIAVNGTASIPHAAITGGTITGLSAPIPVASGGTGANTAAGALTALGAAPIISTNTTLNVPSQYSTVQAALDSLVGVTFAPGVIVTIKIADGSYSWSDISSTHPQGSAINIIGDQTTPANVVITYDASNAKNGFKETDNFAIGLIDGVTIQSNAWQSHGSWNMAITPLGSAIATWNGGYIHVGPNVRVTKSYYGIRAINGGKILVDSGAQVSEAGDVGIHAFGGEIWADGTTVFNTSDTGATGPVGTGYLAENGGSLHAELSTSYGNTQHGFAAYNGALWAPSSISYNNTHNGYFAYQGGRIVAPTGSGEQTTQAYGNGQFGVYALGGGSQVFFQGGSTHNNTSDGVSVDGGTIDITGGSTTNNTGAGRSAWNNGLIYGAPTSTGNGVADYANNGGILNGVVSSASLAGATFTGAVSLGYSTPILTLNDTSGTNFEQINLSAAGVTGWDVGANSSGGNFYVGRFTGGAFTDAPFLISRSTGLATFADGITASIGKFTTLQSTGPGAMPLYSATGTAVNAPHMVTGSVALSSGAATITLSGSAVFASSSSYVCTANDTTAAVAVKVGQTSGTSITFTGTSTDTVQFSCVGN